MRILREQAFPNKQKAFPMIWLLIRKKHLTVAAGLRAIICISRTCSLASRFMQQKRIKRQIHRQLLVGNKTRAITKLEHSALVLAIEPLSARENHRSCGN